MRLRNSLHTYVAVLALASVALSSCASPIWKKETPATARGTNAAPKPTQGDEQKAVNRTQTENLSNTDPAGPPRPKILSRSEWNAKDAAGKMEEHTPRHITIHHTASPQKAAITIERKMQNLQSFSQSEGRLASGGKKPAWPDVPYHYYIAVDGRIAEGRDIKYVGDTNTDYDPAGHALVVLEGNFEKEQPSSKQLESLGQLVAWLSANYSIPVPEIKGHSDYASTACPGASLKKLLPAVRQQVAGSTVDNR
jgi:hypothetical protein